MSILDRLNLLVRSNLSDALDGSSKRTTLSDMEESLREARRRQAQLERGEKELIDEIREARETADQWEERAMLALKKDDEELAREALIVKNKSMRQARKLRDQLDDHREHIEDIQKALEALEHKLEGTRKRIRAQSQSGEQKRIGSSRSSSSSTGDSRAAKWDEKLRRRTGESPGASSRSSAPDPEVSETFDTSDKFREMDRMAGKIDGMEAEIEAMRELDDIGGDSRRAELERKFRSMEQKRSSKTRRRRDRAEPGAKDDRPDNGDGEPPIDDDLADLKKKFE